MNALFILTTRTFENTFYYGKKEKMSENIIFGVWGIESDEN